jgi:transposase
VYRRFRALPIGSKGVWIDLPVQRVECRSCGVVQQVQVQFADQRRSYTSSFERYAVDLCRWMTIQDVANHLGVSWDMVKDMHKRYPWPDLHRHR